MTEQGIEKVAVIGAGLMGFGIGVEFARWGYPVSMYNTSEASSKVAMERSREALDLMVETELITAEEAEAAYGRLIPTTDMADAVSGAQYVVESVHEVLTLKQDIFARLDEMCDPSVLLATNTSSLKVTDIAAKVKHPERVFATHYFQPPHFVPLVEVAPGQKSDRAMMEKAAAILRGMRKRVAFIEVELPAFIGNRIQGAIAREVEWIMDQNAATPELIDDIIAFGFGRRLPYTAYFKRQDLVGLDFRYRGAKARGLEPWKPVAERVERGELGMKSGKGFYDWPGDSAQQLQRRTSLELIRLLKRDMEEGLV